MPIVCQTHLVPSSALFVGGTRSGKSALALRWALLHDKESGRQQEHPQRLFIATAKSVDSEMQERIKAHQKERGTLWQSVEIPLLDLTQLTEIQREAHVIVIDCLSLWLANAMEAWEDGKVLEHIQHLEAWVCQCPVPLALVSSEVGQGIVPMQALARCYRDRHGMLNQAMARACTHVLLISCGLPLVLKGHMPPQFP